MGAGIERAPSRKEQRGEREEERGDWDGAQGEGKTRKRGNRGGGFSGERKMVEMEEDELERRMTCGRRRNWRRWRRVGDGTRAAAAVTTVKYPRPGQGVAAVVAAVATVTVGKVIDL